LDFQEEIQIFVRLGLTGNQAKVYLGLARLGSSTAYVISGNVNVGRSEIYRIMLSLGKMGLVEKILSSPVKFKSISIQDAISLLMSRRMNDISDLDEKTKEVLREFKINATGTTFTEEEPQFIIIPKKMASLQKRRKTIEDSQKTIDAVNSSKRFPVTTFTYVDEIMNALRRGVKIRIVTQNLKNQKDTPEIIELKKKPNFEVRYIRSQPKAVVSIYDGKEVIMTTSAMKGLGESSSLWSNNASLLALAQGYFDILWETANKENNPLNKVLL
jgi:sugar-specific transcriptional regulator TrmB